MIDEEIRRLAGLLGTFVRLSGVPAYRIERQLGMSKGTLTKVLKGQVDLRLRHILMVLDAVHIRPEQFFSMAFGPLAQSASADPAQALLEAMKQVVFVPGRGDRQVEPISDEEFDNRVEAVLRRYGMASAVDAQQPDLGIQGSTQRHRPKRKS